MMRKFYGRICILVLCVVSTILFYGCSIDQNESDSQAETVNFNLSQYSEHGELSCGRIWVIKTDGGSWNSENKKYYGYLDANGELIYGWKEVGSFFDAWGTHDMWYPKDFHNGYAVISQSAAQYGYCIRKIIDTSGNEIATISVYCGDTTRFGAEAIYFKDFDKDGYAYYAGDKGIFFVDKNGSHKFTGVELNLGAYKEMRRQGDYFYQISYGYIYYLFNNKGALILDFYKSEIGTRPYRIEILSENRIRANFVGKDDKKYTCVLNFNGKIIEEPTID